MAATNNDFVHKERQAYEWQGLLAELREFIDDYSEEREIPRYKV